MTTLVTLRPGVTLEAEAAASWARMEAERGAELDTNSTYRDYDEQAKARRAYLAYVAYLNGGPWAPWAPLALDPDESWHCLGLAVDTDDDEWVRAHPQFGWRFVVSSERWHAQYYPTLDLRRGTGFPAGVGSKPFNGEPTSPIRKVHDMLIVSFYPDYGQVLITSGDGAHALTDFEALVHRQAGVPAVDWKGDDANGSSYGGYVKLLVEKAWERSNISRDRVAERVEATLAAAEAVAKTRAAG